MKELHWMTVGHISKNALKELKDAGGKVIHVQATADVPAIFMVGIPCEFFSRNSNDVEIKGWNELFIKVPSHGLFFSLSSQLHKQSLHISQVPVHQTGLALINEKMFK